MATNTRPVYKRILLKLSGEALQDSEGFGINASILNCVVREVKKLVELGIQVGIAIGGSNLFHGADLAKAGMNRVVDDHMGMLATAMNSLVMRGALHRAYVNARLMSTVPLNGVCDSYNWAEAIGLLRDSRAAILSADIGDPSFTTNSATYLRGIEIEADVVLKVTKVDGVFTADPAKDLMAAVYEQLTYAEVLDKELKIMDPATLTLVRNHRLPIRVFNMNKPGTPRHIVMGEKGSALIVE